MFLANYRPSKFLVILFISLFFGACNQENMVFNPEKLPQDFVYKFDQPFQELFIDVGNNVKINGLLFSVEQSKGLVFYLHGNAGQLDTWGTIADLYVNNGYDFFIMDYRSFGKSTGVIDKEKPMYADIQTVYDSLQHQFGYKNEQTVIIGYSIGTGFAAKLAADNNPKLLILKAPYYSLPNLVNQYYKIVPNFMVKFKLPTYQYIQKVEAPIVIFHGDKDQTIPIKSSYKLKKYLGVNDTLIVLNNQNHQGISNNKEYIKLVSKYLSK